MGAIEDVYEDLEADVDRDEFEASVREKVEQMDGLADEETAAMLSHTNCASRGARSTAWPTSSRTWTR